MKCVLFFFCVIFFVVTCSACFFSASFVEALGLVPLGIELQITNNLYIGSRIVNIDDENIIWYNVRYEF